MACRNLTISRLLWLRWIGATVIGWLAGSLVVWAIQQKVGGPVGHLAKESIGLVLTGALIGAATGIAQSFVLPRALATARWWIAASAIGWGIGLTFAQTLSDALPEDYLLISFLAGGVLFAVAIGVSQWILLRRTIPGSTIWIWSTTVGWSIGGVVNTLSGSAGAVSLAIGSFAVLGIWGWCAAIAVGAIAGVTTGLTLQALAFRSRSAISRP